MFWKNYQRYKMLMNESNFQKSNKTQTDIVRFKSILSTFVNELKHECSNQKIRKLKNGRSMRRSG